MRRAFHCFVWIVLAVGGVPGSSGASQTAMPEATLTGILGRMAANTAGLTTFVVPVTLAGTVKKGALNLPFSIDGIRYFKSPDKNALEMHSIPSIAKAFQTTYASLGTPATWPQTFDITLASKEQQGDVVVYELRGTYKHPSAVDHILLDVDGTTFDPIRARWFYRNGATMVLSVRQASVDDGKYRLPVVEMIDASFPQYHGTATVRYGPYQTNVPVSDSHFAH